MKTISRVGIIKKDVTPKISTAKWVVEWLCVGMVECWFDKHSLSYY